MNSGQELAQVLEIWKRVLKSPTIDADSEFFESGGDSLLAIEVALEIERVIGHGGVQPGLVFQLGTPRKLALWLAGSASPIPLSPATGSDSLVGDGPGAPVFFVPGIAGYGRAPKPMTDALAGRHPYFDRLYFPQVGSSASVEEIAHGLVAQVHRVCPTGPYILNGYSYGGCVAYELARQLTEAGQRVELVILWDSFPIVGIERRSPFAAISKLVRVAFLSCRWDNRASAKNRFASFRRRLPFIRKKVSAPTTTQLIRDEQSFRPALPKLKTYRPLSYAGRVALLLCEKEDDTWVFERYVEDRTTWIGLLAPDQLSVITVPCNHSEMRNEPHLDTCINAILEMMTKLVGVAAE